MSFTIIWMMLCINNIQCKYSTSQLPGQLYSNTHYSKMLQLTGLCRRKVEFILLIIPWIFSPGVSLAICGTDFSTHSLNPNCGLLFQTNSYKANLSKYPP